MIVLLYVSGTVLKGIANVSFGFRAISPLPAFVPESHSCVEVDPFIVTTNVVEIEQLLPPGNVQVLLPAHAGLIAVNDVTFSSGSVFGFDDSGPLNCVMVIETVQPAPVPLPSFTEIDNVLFGRVASPRV